MRLLLLTLLLCSCAAIDSPPQVTTFDGTYLGPVTLKDGGSRCPVPDREFVLNIDKGRATNGWPFIPNADALIWPDGKLPMTGRAYQMNLRVSGQVRDDTYDATSYGWATCTYEWHLRRQKS
jgi:hypothetical protein